jgi:glycosyltransferase involved in cell wall biosynthesis
LPAIKPQVNSLKTILFVGNFSHGKIKGFDILLLAISIVRKSFPDFILQVIGNGDAHEYDNIIMQNTLRDNIEFLGEKKNVTRYYQAANVFVLPSRSEGMSNSLLEAMAHGTPCIATKVSGAEDIIDNSINGFIVDIEDYQALAEKILEILTKPDLEEKFKKNSREKIEKNFSIEAIAKQYYEVYSKLASNES